MAALFGADLAPRAELARLGLWAREPGTDAAGARAGRSIDPLDLESLRRHPAPAVAPAGESADAEAAPDSAGP